MAPPHDLSAAQAAALWHSLENAGIRCWVMGGWGVDALLECETRAHHDLDLLVQAEDLPALHQWLDLHGFARQYVWPESVAFDAQGQTFETAFVERHPDGRELDVHGIEVTADSSPRLVTTDPWDLPPDALAGSGLIHGRRVSCVSRTAQVAMHRGYELPEKHRLDLDRLDSSR